MGVVDLWLPIVVTAIVVFAASALVWTVLPWHRSDIRKTTNEEAVRAALKDAKPGCYMLPYTNDPAELGNDEVAKKFVEGPQAWITVVPNGLPRTGSKLGATFVFYVAVSAVCACVVDLVLDAGAAYLDVFRIAATTAFVAYGGAYVQDSIWFGRPWSLTAKNLLDALLYGLLTGGVFGWLYPWASRIPAPA